jgi:hypothetical protein
VLYDSVEQIAKRALLLWNGAAPLRAHEEEVASVARTDGHPILIPPSMEGRAFPIYSNAGPGVLEKAKALLVTDEPPQISVLAAGDTQAAIQKQSIAQEWLAGVFALLDATGDRPPREAVTEDALLYARGWWRILPRPQACTHAALASSEAQATAADEAAMRNRRSPEASTVCVLSCAARRGHLRHNVGYVCMAKSIEMSPEEQERMIYAEGLKLTSSHRFIRSTKTSPAATDGALPQSSAPTISDPLSPESLLSPTEDMEGTLPGAIRAGDAG